MEALKVSVVVTVLNEAAGTSALLTALTQQTKQPSEIIIVDGGSTDGTLEVVETFIQADQPVRLLHEPGCNISEGRNLGINSARNEIIACTDAGCVPQDTWLSELTGPFYDTKVAVVGGLCQADARNRLEQVIGLMTVPGELTVIEPTSFNPSARNIAFRKSSWRRAGGFPEWLYTAEDTLFDCQLRKIGAGFSFAPKARVHWRPRQTLPALWRQISGYAQGEGRIGRAGEASRFWRRRYAVTAGVLLSCLISAYLLASLILVAVGFSATAFLMMVPLSLTAFQVANKTGRMSDFPLAIMIGQVMSLADVVGFTRGTAQRLRNPEDFIGPLKAYWGKPAVVDVPKWLLVNAPTPKTLIVSWHWAPNSRACANVLSNFFAKADKEVYSVITRAIPLPRNGDEITTPAIPTQRISWPTWCTHQSGFVFTLASLLAMLRMVQRAIHYQKNHGFNRTIAVYPHRFSLLVGLLISIVTGTKLVVFMHDLLAESLHSRALIYRAWWRMIDRVVLNRAWFVVVPTDEFADYYRKRGLSKTVVIPHCLPTEATTTHSQMHQSNVQPNIEITSNTDDIESQALACVATKSESKDSSAKQQQKQQDTPSGRVDNGINENSGVVAQGAETDVKSASTKACGSGRSRPLRLVYAGKVYEAHEDAIQALIAATQDFATVDLTLLSNAHMVTKSGQSTWLSRCDALRAIEQADVGIVALGMKTPYPTEIAGCFPSKIIDYIAIGRPILAVVPLGCFVDRFVRESGCGVVVESFSAVDIQAAITEMSDPKVRDRMTISAITLREKLKASDWITALNRWLTVGLSAAMAMPIATKQASDTLLTRAKPASYELEFGVNL